MKTAILFLITVLAATTLAATRTPYSYHEDFATRQFRDAMQTTADWDTVTMSLRQSTSQGTLVGTWNSPGTAVGIAVDGDVAFVADQAAGLQIVSVAEPAHPVSLGALNTTGAAWDVDAEGDWVFVADGAAGLVAIDVTSLSHPTVGSVYDSPGTAYAVDVAGDAAYVADGTGGLRVVSIVDPQALASRGTVTVGGLAYDVKVDGDVAWVAAYDAGLVAVSVTNPAAPAVLGSLNTTGRSTGVAIDGDWAYVADGTNGLVVVDITTPAAPVLRATLALADLARGVAADGDWVYVADENGGLNLVDVSDPLQPALVHTQTPPANARAVALAGEYAFVADNADGLRVLKIATTTVPLEPAAAVATTYPGNDQEVAGDYLYQTNYYQGVSVFDVSDPLTPVIVGNCDTDYAAGLALAGDRLYVADMDYGLKVINVADPTHPAQVGSYAGTGPYYDVTVAGDYLLVANQAYGLTILDNSHTAAPTLMSHLATGDWAWEIVVAGNVAYVADYRAGLTVIDITDPFYPSVLARLDLVGDLTGLAVSGDYVYGACWNQGLVVINVHDPAAPALVATCPSTQYGRKVVVQGDRAYLSEASQGLKVIDIANPLAPVVLDAWQPGGSVYNVALAGDVAFVVRSGPNYLTSARVRARTGEPGNRARSLAVDCQDETLLKYRLTTAQTGNFSWSLLAGGDEGSWQAVSADGAWHDLATPGEQLRWKTVIGLEGGAACTAVDLAWLSAAPIVGAVTDIPADQGGRVRVRVARSAFDFAQEATPITGYNVWRRVDDAALRRAVAAAPLVDAEEAIACDLTLRELGGRRFATNGRGLPPGTWEIVSSFWAAQQDEYLVQASTLADSSQTIPWSVYCVTAHTATPSLWYASPPDSGYSIDNIAPAAPAHLALVASTLTWDPAPEPDFAYSTVYGSNVPYLDDSAVPLGDTVVPTFEIAASYPNYLVTTRDVAGNESDAAVLSTATAVGDAPPARTALVGVAPNPFNPRTMVRYELASAEVVTLRIYDAAGRLVRTLLDGAPQPAGRHEATWDGCTDGGAAAATGVYCCRMTAGDQTETCRMTLVK